LPVLSSELLARFVFHHSHIRASDNSVRPAAFLPKDGMTSVFRISNLTDQEVWEIGEREVVPRRGHPLLGRADLSVSTVINNGLEVRPQEPPLRHANILGWPDEKSKQTMIALELAVSSQLYRR
jgi:hypothetical protein